MKHTVNDLSLESPPGRDTFTSIWGEKDEMDREGWRERERGMDEGGGGCGG